MNHPPRLQTTARAEALVAQYKRESAHPFTPKGPKLHEDPRWPWFLAINKAEMEGNRGYADVLKQFMQQAFPIP